PPATFRLFGPRVVPTFNYFQTAAVLGAEGYLGTEDVARVGRVLLEGAGYTARGLENSLGDLVRRGFLEPAAAGALGTRLRAAGVLPPADGPRARWRRVLGALGRRRRGRRVRAGRAVYRWGGAVEEAAEHLLLVKARAADVPALDARVRALHAYQVPEVLALGVSAGSGTYLAWLAESTARDV